MRSLQVGKERRGRFGMRVRAGDARIRPSRHFGRTGLQGRARESLPRVGARRHGPATTTSSGEAGAGVRPDAARANQAPERVTGTRTAQERRPHHARRRVRPHAEAAPARSGAASTSHGSGQRPRHDGPRRGLAISPAYHTAITNWVDALGPRGSDLHFHAHGRLEQTPLDGLYNLCQVVPSEGPRIRTGASSGPSKRYCRVFGGVSLTPQTFSRLTDVPITWGAGNRSDQVEDRACGIPPEASDDLASGLALLDAAFVVLLGAWVVAQAGEDDAVQGGVGLAVAADPTSTRRGWLRKAQQRMPRCSATRGCLPW